MNTTRGKADKSRFLATIAGQIPDRVPNFEVLIEQHAVSHILGKNVDQHTLSFALPPADYMELARRIGQDLVGCSFFMFPYLKAGEDGKPAPLSSLSPAALTVGPFVEGGCAGSEGFDRKYVGPEVTLDPQLGGIRPAWEAYVDAVAGTEIGLFALTGMLSQAIYQFTLGVENFMLATYDEPEFVAHLLDESMGFHRKIVEFLCDYPLDVLYLADDVAFRNGLMINPEHFKRMWIPRMKHVMEPAEQKGIPIIFHSDGTLYDLIPSLIEMGFTCLNPIEPYGMDILEVKRRWGNDIALMGNFDIAGTLAFGTPDEVRQEVSEALPALKAGGRYIAASSHSITSAVPPENFLAMLDVVHTEGSYGT